MKKSIKSRLVINFMLVIVITVVILQLVLSNAIKDYYYKNVEDILSSQIEYSTDFYSKYFSTFTIDDIILGDIDLFWRYTTAQVQLLSLEGELLMDSLGVVYEGPINTSDVIKAKNLEKGVWVGNVSYDDSPVMAVSLPLRNYEEPIGIIRFITSLEETNRTVNRIINFMIVIGLVVIAISGLVSVLLANSIVKPLLEVTKVAEKMADGQLRVRGDIHINDEIGQLSNTLNYMAEEILKKEQIKNDFISSVSHELRTPLTSIKGWAITLQGDDTIDPELLKDGLEIIETESDRLSKMVEELLDFSKFISGRVTLEKFVFSIRDTIKMIEKQYMPRAKYNQVDLKVNIADDVQLFLGDENRIKQLLLNLLDNAVKFTPAGGAVHLNSFIEDNNLVLTVKDTGIGIPPEDLPHVKEKFYKGKHSKSHSGIGLSICEEIVSLCNGILDIESEINKGTTVRVVLPIKEEEI
ncbi:MAG: HAMP domain-containing sensor histidine kinase [Tissierellaceae bacterium]|nr:HAMP domain-containing sensor histidine kinase [Tissierellaceae bacterium]